MRRTTDAPKTIGTVVGFNVDAVTPGSVVVQFSVVSASITYLNSLKLFAALDSEIDAIKSTEKSRSSVTLGAWMMLALETEESAQSLKTAKALMVCEVETVNDEEYLVDAVVGVVPFVV